MAVWTLLLMRSPLNTGPGDGTGQVRELTRASGRKFTFVGTDPHTLSFDMPGRDPQTALLDPLESDILAFRDEQPVQRFRVVSRSLSKDSGVLTASFAAVSYKGLLDAWLFHDADTRSWPAATEQTAIAWQIISEGQAKPNGKLGLTRGPLPTTSVSRVLEGEEADFQRAEFYDAGKNRREAIDELAAMTADGGGFDWDIVPDPAAPYTALKAMFWTKGDGGRNQFKGATPPRSGLLLDDGGSLASWSHNVAPSDFGNVLRFTGNSDTSENTFGATSSATWVPGQDPTQRLAAGRWERDQSNTDLTDDATTAAAAKTAYDAIERYVPEISATMQQGRWHGPVDDVVAGTAGLWVGDVTRFIITEPVEGLDPRPYATAPDDWILYIDEDVTVVQVDVDVENEGAETVTLALNRKPYSAADDARTTNDRLRKIERR